MQLMHPAVITERHEWETQKKAGVALSIPVVKNK